MTREQIEEAIDEQLNSIVFDEDGAAVWFDSGEPVSEEDMNTAWVELQRLNALLAACP